MALISCPECSTQVSEKAVSCPSCGCPIAAKAEQQVTDPSAAPIVQVATAAKSRWIFIILGLLFGVMGFHNFYAGYNWSGAIKIVIFCLGLVTGLVLVAVGINSLWALVEVIFCDEEANDRKFI